MCIMKLTLKLKIFKDDDVIRDVENDDDNEANDIEINNKMKDDNCVKITQSHTYASRMRSVLLVYQSVL